MRLFKEFVCILFCLKKLFRLEMFSEELFFSQQRGENLHFYKLFKKIRKSEIVSIYFTYKIRRTIRTDNIYFRLVSFNNFKNKRFISLPSIFKSLYTNSFAMIKHN